MEINLLNIIYIVLFIGVTFIRKLQTNKYKQVEVKQEKPGWFEMLLLIFVGMGMIAPFINIFSKWLSFADYSLQSWIQYLGIILFIISCYLIWKSHADLGKNWSISIAEKENQSLVTNGMYKNIRHPMYSAHLVWAIANVLIIPNWIAGASFLVSSVIFYAYRIPKEERILTSLFQKEYLEYRKGTKTIIPFLF